MIFRTGKQELEIDLIEADTVLGGLTSKLVAVKGMVQPTPEFLRKFADWVKLKCNAKVAITLAEAWQIWKVVVDKTNAAQKEQATNADIAYWFKVNPTTLTESEKLGLIANLPRVQAQDRIQRGDFSATDFKGIYQLYLLAYGDEDLAQKKQTEAAKAYLEQESKRGKNYG
jgi:hypothetical protein